MKLLQQALRCSTSKGPKEFIYLSSSSPKMFALKSLFVSLLTLVGFAAAAHTSMTVTYFKSNSNCTQPTGVKNTVQTNVCLGTSEYKDGSSTAMH